MTRKQRILLYIGVAIFGIILTILMVLIHEVSKKSDERDRLALEQAKMLQSVTPTPVPSLTTTVTTTVTATATVTATETPVATVEANLDLNSVKAVVANFMQAYVARNLEQAKPYMTDEFLSSFTSADFAGVSSPSRDRFEIVSASVVEADKRFYTKVYLYFKLDGADSGTSILELNTIKDGSKFLVSSMQEAQ